MSEGGRVYTAAASPGRPRSPLVELQHTLYNSRNPTRRWLHRERLERISSAVREAAASTGARRGLEVGPGGGPYTGLLCDLFEEAYATDIEPEYLGHVRDAHGERPNLTLMVDDIARSSLQPASFDVVLCTEVIEHTPRPDLVLAGIRRVLRPGGILVLSTPQAFSTIELLGRVAFWPGVIQIVRALYREPILPTGHISLLTRRRLGAMLARAGFAIRESQVGGLYLPVAAELGGERALALERRLASRLAGGPLAWALWTQYWVCERPA